MGYIVAVNVDIQDDTNIEELVQSICENLDGINLVNKVIDYSVVMGKLIIKISGDADILSEDLDLFSLLSDRPFDRSLFMDVLFSDDIMILITNEFNGEEMCAICVLMMLFYSKTLVSECVYMYILQQFIREAQLALKRRGISINCK